MSQLLETVEDVIPKGWHVTKNVPLALLLALIGQTVVVGFVAGKYDSHITDHDVRIIEIERKNKEMEATTLTVVQRLANIEGKLEFLVMAAKDKQK